jgi:microcystin-dependent protein
MSNPFIGEIRMFGGNFAPAGWAFCNGQTLPIAENEPLFVLLGTTYGGDGQNTFQLPDLQSRLPIHFGTSFQGNSFTLAQNGGAEDITLTVAQLPAHTHPMLCSNTTGSDPNPTNNLPAESSAISLYSNQTPSTPMAAGMIQNVGGSQPHTNLQPFLCVNFIISLFGIFPSQT